MTEDRVEEPALQVDGDTDDGEVYVEYDITAYPSDLTLSVIHEMWGCGRHCRTGVPAKFCVDNPAVLAVDRVLPYGPPRSPGVLLCGRTKSEFGDRRSPENHVIGLLH